MTKEEKLIYDKEWRAKNREKTRAAYKKWYATNKEKAGKRVKACRQKNPASSRRACKKWAQKNKEYRKDYMQNFRKANRKHHNETNKLWKQDNPRAAKNYDLKKNYGITVDKYEQMLCAQEDRCAICTIHKDELKKVLCVDHCHDTGFIRGLVCDPCNKALGFLKNNPQFCNNAASYLENAQWKIFIAQGNKLNAES